MRGNPMTDFEFSQVDALDGAEMAELLHPTLWNFQHFIQFTTRRTQLAWIVGRQAGRIRGVAPLVRLHRRSSTETLRPALRRWLVPLGAVSRKTTYLIDTAFLGYDYVTPFFTVPEVDRSEFREAVIRYLQSDKQCDAIWIGEPAGTNSSAAEDFLSFQMLPMSHVVVDGYDTVDQRYSTLSKKRRRNLRIDRECFTQSGGRFELLNAPFSDRLTDSMLRCLKNSERKNEVYVPYNDVLIGNGFRTQAQTAICAWVGDRFAGFMSFIRRDRVLLQCHGGFDYTVSLPLRAYPNLIYESMQYAMDEGLDRVSLGPLNNETKRRLSTQQMPMHAHLWNRKRLDRIVVRRYFAKNFQAYFGPATVDSNGDPSDQPRHHASSAPA